MSGPYNEPGNELELGTGGGYGGAGFQEGGDWTQSTETTPISSGTQYEVKSGDTLQDIADRSGTDVSTLKTQSGDPNLIVPGEKIDIGEASSPAAAQEARERGSGAVGGRRSCGYQHGHCCSRYDHYDYYGPGAVRGRKSSSGDRGHRDRIRWRWPA